MGKRQSSGGGVLIAIVVGIFYVLAQIPKEVWVLIGLIAGGYFVYWVFKKVSDTSDAPSPSNSIAQKVYPPLPSTRQILGGDVPMPVSQQETERSFKLPPAPSGFGAAKWIEPGESVTIGGIDVLGGMIYVGTGLHTSMGGNDPCLIDPKKTIAARGDYTSQALGYWPSYSEISASARRAYIDWLADGRKDPKADIGFVFLFFYGLERRAILDAARDTDTRKDWSAIAMELRRLLSIYGEKSSSFQHYASALLDWVSLGDYFGEKLYHRAVPSFPRSYELPLYLRLALGQTAVDGVPVPAALALEWAKLAPTISLRTPAIRCRTEFDELFVKKYRALYADGIVLPKNKTKLKLVYRPASSGFHGLNHPELTFGETPDVSVLTGPIKKLQVVVEEATQELDAYSRYLGKNPQSQSSLEALLLLPATLWPDEQRKALEGLKARMGAGMVVMPFGEVQSSLGAQSTLTRDKALALARALESANIGLEPDLLSGAKMPKPEDQVVLFSIAPSDSTSRSSAGYQAAALTLQLASAVATADGDFTAKEIKHLTEHVQAWSHLTPDHIQRLKAHLRLLMEVPVSLASIKKKLEPLDTAAKESIAVFMATFAQSDGTVTPEEVKILEKVYKALGIDSNKVFSDVHVAATGASAPPSKASAPAAGFALDAAKIAALQKDTERVTALLSTIFQDEQAAPTTLQPTEEAEDAEPLAKGILGLDEQHSELARLMLSRPQWSREELQDAVSDLELMLDGALEHINEAAFDQLDVPFTEGDDPIEVNAEILEKITI